MEIIRLLLAIALFFGAVNLASAQSESHADPKQNSYNA